MKALTQNEEKLLCGRAELVREIVENCRAGRFTVLTSQPGLGITSLVQAGVAPSLRRAGFIVTVFSEWQGRSFATQLKEAIASAVRQHGDPLFFTQNEDLKDLLTRAAEHTGKPAAILLDQFEDYLRCHSHTIQSDSFDAELGYTVADRKGIFVVGLQEHAIPAFARLEPFLPNLLGYHIQLQPLTVAAAKEAVLAEARAVHTDVEPAALDALTSAPVVARGGKVHPFFLKVAISALLDAEWRLTSSTLRSSTIAARGGVDRIVFESLDGPIGELGSTQLDLLFRWCTMLISPEKRRLAVTAKELTERAGGLNWFVPGLLEQLQGAGIIRRIEISDSTHYELSRECYAPILRNWWERRKVAIVARRRALLRMASLFAISAAALFYAMWLIFRASK